MSGEAARSEAYGERGLSLVDRLGVHLSARAVAGRTIRQVIVVPNRVVNVVV